jgi:cell wall-associated NlpC family hydrolase
MVVDVWPLTRSRRWRLDAHLVALAVLLCTTACASTGAVPRPFPIPGSPDNHPLPEPSPVLSPAPPVEGVDMPVADSPVVAAALAMQGVPYRNGGENPDGFDCSGLVTYVFAQQGVWVPRTVSEQFAFGDRVDSNALAPGDLVFFTTVAPGASHVGIVVSGQHFVHAPSSTGVVRVEQLGAPYWASRYVGARRVR